MLFVRGKQPRNGYYTEDDICEKRNDQGIENLFRVDTPLRKELLGSILFKKKRLVPSKKQRKTCELC